MPTSEPAYLRSHRGEFPRILLVEDNPGDARLLTTYLEEADFFCRLLSADSLSDALSIVSDDHPDLCLLDLGLPDSEGVETVERFRERNGDLPVVVLTGLDDPGTAIAALRAGAEEYLVKGEVTPRNLDRTLRFVLERAEARRQQEVAQERWATVFELAPAGIAITHPETGEIFDINQACAEMLGYTPDEMKCASVHELNIWEDPSRRADLVERVREQGEVRDERVRFRHRSGETRHIKVAIRQLAMAGGARLLWAERDITEQVEREWALEESTQALAERVKEQSCLYDVSRILQDHETSIDSRLQDIAEGTPLGWQYPEVAVCRLKVQDKTYTSDDFTEAAPQLETVISLDGERVGTIEVAYLEERPEEDIGPFLEEEQRLLEEIAGRVTVELERERVHRQRERLVEILENTTDFVGMSTPDGQTLWINQPGREMLGIPEDQELRDIPISAWSPDWAAEKILGDGLPRAREQGAWEGGTALLTRGGEEIPVSQVIIAHRGDDGEPSYYSTIARDISDRKEAERKIRRSETRHRALFATSPDPIVMSTRDGELLRANDAFLNLIGYSRGELEKLNMGDLYDDPAERKRLVESLESSGQVSNFEFSARTKDESRRIIELTASLVQEPERSEPIVQAIGRDVTEQREMEDALRHRTFHDTLTGLGNRVMLEDRLTHLVDRARGESSTVALLMMDISRFKRINDSLGHTAGDRILKAVARRLKDCVRQEDTVVRWGGDEFVILMEDSCNEDDVSALRYRLQRTLEDPIRVGDTEVNVDINVGAALFGPTGTDETVDVKDPSELVRSADNALQRAKSSPDASFHLFYPAEHDEAGHSLLEREQDLRRGLEAGEFEPFYQPILRLETGQIWGVEPLARWRHPERGLVSPGEFIPLAEETDLIQELGQQILSAACHDVSEWSRGDGPGLPLRITPNVSGGQFESIRLILGVEEALENSGIHPECVFMEVTETSIMRATERIDELRDLGVGVLVDDFGTGFSSFTYLRDLTVDGLKIDMSFVQGLGEKPENDAVVETMLTLGRELNLLVVAEGIENDRQLRRLRARGCELGQGYRFARPIPAEEMSQYIQTGATGWTERGEFERSPE